MEEPADSGGGGAAQGPTAQVAEIRCPIAARPMRLLEWKVKPGSLVNVDSVLALCAPIPPEKEAGSHPPEQPNRLSEKKLKSDRAGVVKELCCQLGQVISPGGVIVRVKECSHPIVMKGLCAECGQDLTQMQTNNGRQQALISTANVSMVHSVPELMVSSEQAEQLGREDQQRLHRNKKLVLMVDLDQTLIHTTEHHCQRMSNKGIFHFQLGRGEPMLHTRLRPHCKDFLEKIAKLYELHVFTFGSRLYAHTIAGFLDPEMKLFSHRILSRDECIDPFSKTGNLRNLFPCGDSMVCIIDDREDVWKFAPNLITVKKYIYFQGTGDINAPPGSKEAQQGRKGSQASRPAEASEPAVTSGTTGPTAGPSGGSSASEEQSNGLKKQRTKDYNNGGREESTAPSVTQGAAANERTQPDGGEAVEEGRGQGEGAEASTAAQVSDRTNVKDEGKDGSRTLGSGEEAPLPGGLNSSTPRPPSSTPPDLHEPNSNLDFDLSSDSDSDSLKGKPPSSDNEREGVSSQTKKSKQEGAEQAAVEEPSGGAGGKKGESKEKSTGENSSAVVGVTSEETSGSGVVFPPDPEQENGRSERREAETESQNSEQSGVTMGEESLDPSMEEEEEEEEEKEEVDVDKDDHLIYLEEVLERIHGEYYARYDAFLRKERQETPDIRKIVPELKARSLEGTTIVFSGLYPTNYPMERTRENYHAKALGAKLGKGLLLSSKDPGRTTHLIAARAGTEKVRQAQGCKHLHVVNPDWLWGCLERWERVEESLYPLKEDYTKTQRSNSPAAFPDLQGTFQNPLFPPAPLHHHRPSPAAPEVRTYDPVTGKLIRRGPQPSRPPSYLQASMSAAHCDQTSLRGGQKDQQGETAGPSSRDEEQPGPSCRRRERQPSMSETNPLYTFCKEDLDSMDKEVDDMLDEESDEDGEGRGKKTREMEEEDEMEDEEEGQRPQGSRQSTEGEKQHHHQQQGLATVVEEAEKTQTPPSDQGDMTLGSVQRGQKRKLAEANEEEEGQSADESTKDSNEEEEGSSSEADEMAAALDAELNDFM
ncbi:RNA polymerase II subunit A C-terminal domain phosphatase isoform X2 [Coregonus clupeaformis]|uniref:RNA polymerase II subunit A C-terminal domain phosphatase isoform X2 n=1 Tax=Coregonus clupeaformis TaxID=59861 RepID=UPI001E1C2ABC|nr:RNA polymerase II subunit A C-terminal domain phosphatase isoform X2 [Coregonus clupeaformis]